MLKADVQPGTVAGQLSTEVESGFGSVSDPASLLPDLLVLHFTVPGDPVACLME